MARLLVAALVLTHTLSLRLTSRRLVNSIACGGAAASIAHSCFDIQEVLAAEPAVPLDLGPLGLRKEGASGKLNTCPPQGIKRGCVSTSKLERGDIYVPPWVYQAEDSGAVVTELSKMKTTEVKSVETAAKELADAVAKQPGARVVDAGRTADGRYLRAEFRVSGLFGEQLDDLEFLIAKPGTSDPPFLVDYHSVSRPGNGDDAKRHRERIRDIRKDLEPLGWKSVGRLLL